MIERYVSIWIICILRCRAATLVADTQQHSPKSVSRAPQPYAAVIASHMVARG